MEDLKLGRHLAARDLFARTGPNWALRTRRSQLLAAGAGEGGVFKTWLDEEPNSADASMMWARALTWAALSAHRSGKSRDLVVRAAGLARQACMKAARLLPECPVPWICLLHLTQLPFDAFRFDPYWRSRPIPWDQLGDQTMPYRGPWPLLGEINKRDPGSREGHHRMREFQLHCGGSTAAMNYAGWIAAGHPANLELLMLPLYALMDVYKERHGNGQGSALQFWQTAQVAHYACRARDVWFASVPRVHHGWLSLLDLNYLAHALVACGEEAGAVFHAMGSYVTPEPWRTINVSLGRSYDWTTEFRRIRSAALRERSSW
ncbi:hypothetical protein ACIRPX_45020 [Streptomyces sp. NPDC101225]|uniref:hypothetical protein n=1 Tax=Streptomyces sp. NPDC101225 TaxID=3366135 RepID=UPI0037FF46A9